MHDEFDDSFVQFTLARSRHTRELLLAAPLAPDRMAHFAALSEASVVAQRQLEEADTMPFEIYRQAYLSPERLGL